MRTIIGLGNELRGDDAAGLVAARRLRERGVAARTDTPDALLGSWDGGEDVVLIDAVRSGAGPGTIHRIDPRRMPLPAGLGAASTHLVGLADVIELARQTSRLPAAIEIIGIEGRTFALGAGLSSEVDRAVERVVSELAPGGGSDLEFEQSSDCWKARSDPSVHGRLSVMRLVRSTAVSAAPVSVRTLAAIVPRRAIRARPAGTLTRTVAVWPARRS